MLVAGTGGSSAVVAATGGRSVDVGATSDGWVAPSRGTGAVSVSSGSPGAGSITSVASVRVRLTGGKSPSVAFRLPRAGLPLSSCPTGGILPSGA